MLDLLKALFWTDMLPMPLLPEEVAKLGPSKKRKEKKGKNA
jgi:hypothetical protein